MAKYDLSRLSVLLVEDSRFMTSLLLSVLRALGVERIVTAENGEEAIRILSPALPGSRAKPGGAGVDLVLADLVMPVVDGLMLLRWVRLSEKSPDRFLPFVMISAAADRDVLFDSRDAGLDEFIAKPFSAKSVLDRIMAVIEHPRPYIYCPTYFGPDRRRRRVSVREDRRATRDTDIELVYSGRDLSRIKHSKKSVWIFRIPKHLRKKLSTGSGQSRELPFDPALLAAAEDKIAELESDYADWVRESIEAVEKAYERARADPDLAPTHLAEVNRLAHELRGQGGIFGYPLITQFGKSLYDCTPEGIPITPALLDLIDAHIDLIRIVVNQRIKGDGGETGRELLQNLAKAKKKFSAS